MEDEIDAITARLEAYLEDAGGDIDSPAALLETFMRDGVIERYAFSIEEVEQLKSSLFGEGFDTAAFSGNTQLDVMSMMAIAVVTAPDDLEAQQALVYAMNTVFDVPSGLELGQETFALPEGQVPTANQVYDAPDADAYQDTVSVAYIQLKAEIEQQLEGAAEPVVIMAGQVHYTEGTVMTNALVYMVAWELGIEVMVHEGNEVLLARDESTAPAADDRVIPELLDIAALLGMEVVPAGDASDIKDMTIRDTQMVDTIIAQGENVVFSFGVAHMYGTALQLEEAGYTVIPISAGTMTEEEILGAFNTLIGSLQNNFTFLSSDEVVQLPMPLLNGEAPGFNETLLFAANSVLEANGLEPLAYDDSVDPALIMTAFQMRYESGMTFESQATTVEQATTSAPNVYDDRAVGSEGIGTSGP